MSSPAQYAAESAHFKRGDRVEVLRSQIFWCPANVLRPAEGNRKDKCFVEFESLDAEGEERSCAVEREYVSVGDVRPVPPAELNRYFMIGEIVETFFEKEGWRSGQVKDVLENSKYEVMFDNGKMIKEFDQWNVRLSRVWDDGCWDPPLQLQYMQPCEHKFSDLEARPKKLKVKVKYRQQTSEEKFREGMLVEVRSDEEDLRGAWYTARVVTPVGNGMFLVEYQKLKFEDGSGLLKASVNVSCIRPCPPISQRNDCFKELEQVDAMINDGWWEGHVSKVLSENLYLVHITSTDAEMLFGHFQLRSHKEWVDDNWVSACEPNFEEQSCSPNVKPNLKFKVKCNEKSSIPTFSRGTMVEVKSNEEGYHGAWYTAVIVETSINNKYLVEYQTLKTDDEAEPLKESADAPYVRPVPPRIQRIDRFKILEEVDAWYNDGWWIGLINKIVDSFRYTVYFWTTNEEIEFHHLSLRPHQEWICGKWIISYKKESKLAVKPTVGKLQIPYGEGISQMTFSKGAKVEVKSSKKYYEGLWFPAIVLRPPKNGKYLVEFLTLTTVDAAELLIEEADALMMRPCPPITQSNNQFKPLEQIDAWYRGGWSVGQICKVFNGSKYTVYFKSTKEVLEFEHSYLRLHREWIDDKWITATRRQTDFMSFG